MKYKPAPRDVFAEYKRTTAGRAERAHLDALIAQGQARKARYIEILRAVVGPTATRPEGAALLATLVGRTIGLLPDGEIRGRENIAGVRQ